MNVVQTDDWTLDARCRGMADALFPEGKDQKRARIVCMGCPVRAVCLAEALDNRIEWGVWGGLTERERRQLLRQRPDVTSWLAVLKAATDAASPVHETLPSGVAEVMRGLPADHPHVRAALSPVHHQGGVLEVRDHSLAAEARQHHPVATGR